MPRSNRASSPTPSSTHSCAAVTLCYPEDLLTFDRVDDSEVASENSRTQIEGSTASDEGRSTLPYPRDDLRRELESISRAASEAASTIGSSVGRSRSPSVKSAIIASSAYGRSRRTPDSPRHGKPRSKPSDYSGSGRPRVIPAETVDDVIARDELLQRAVGDSQELHAVHKRASQDSPTSAPAPPARRNVRGRRRSPPPGNPELSISSRDDGSSIRSSQNRRRATPRRVPSPPSLRAPSPELPTSKRGVADEGLGQRPEKKRISETDDLTRIQFEDLKRQYELQLHVLVSSVQAQSNADLRATEAMLECQNHSRLQEANCEVLLALQSAHIGRVALETRQRHGALEGVEGLLYAARTAEEALCRQAQCGFDAVSSRHADELSGLKAEATRDVERAQAEVANQEEVLQRYTSETATQATAYEAELQSAVARATQAAEESYKAETLRERDAHQLAASRLELSAEESVAQQLQLRLRFREEEVDQETKVHGAEMSTDGPRPERVGAASTRPS